MKSDKTNYKKRQPDIFIVDEKRSEIMMIVIWRQRDTTNMHRHAYHIACTTRTCACL